AVTTTDHIPADGAVSTNRPSLPASPAAAGSGAVRPASTARRQAWLLCKGRSETFTAAGAPRTSPETWSGSAEAPAGARRQTARAAGSKEWEYIRSLLDKM